MIMFWTGQIPDVDLILHLSQPIIRPLEKRKTLYKEQKHHATKLSSPPTVDEIRSHIHIYTITHLQSPTCVCTRTHTHCRCDLLTYPQLHCYTLTVTPMRTRKMHVHTHTHPHHKHTCRDRQRQLALLCTLSMDPMRSQSQLKFSFVLFTWESRTACWVLSSLGNCWIEKSFIRTVGPLLKVHPLPSYPSQTTAAIHTHSHDLKQNETQSASAESTNKGDNQHSKAVTQAQQRLELPIVTLTWHVSKYNVHNVALVAKGCTSAGVYTPHIYLHARWELP